MKANKVTMNSFFPSSVTTNIPQPGILKRPSELRRNVSNMMNVDEDEVNIHNFHYGGGATQSSTGKNRTRKSNGLSGGPV